MRDKSEGRAGARRRLGLAAVAAIAAAAIGWGATLPASAAANQYAPSVGTVTGSVPSGPASSAPTVVASGTCPAGTQYAQGFLDGPGLVKGVLIASDSLNVATMNSGGIPSSFGLTQVAKNTGAVLVNGTYDVSLVCDPGFGAAYTAQYDGQIVVTGGATATSEGTTYTWKSTGPAATATSLAVTPTGGAAQGASVTLTASVSPSGAAGSVQFVDLATGSAVNVGTPVTVSGGTAALTTSGLATGNHTLRADFIPTDSAAFGASNSSTVAYAISAKQPTATTTTLVVTPAGTAVAGTSVQLSASVTPAAAAGSVQFVDLASGSPVNIGSPVTVSGGAATASTTSLAQGNHSLEAMFTPTDATAYTDSASSAVTYVITTAQQSPTTTTTALTANPAATAVAGDPVTLTATLSPAAAAGSVQFVDIASGNPVNVGSAVAVANGKTTVTVTSLGQGDHSLRADFTPTDAAAYTASSSSTLAYTISAPVQQPAATTTTLTAAPAGGSTQGNAVTFTATVSPVAAAGGVQFSDTVNGSSTPLGSPVQVSAGAATLTTSNLALGTHQITASFTPTDAAAFSSSASSPLSYQVSSSTPNPTAKPTVTRLAVLPLPWWAAHDCSHDEYEGTGSQRSGPGALLLADVRSNRAAGSVQFFETFDGVQQPIGDPVVVRHGLAQLVAKPLATGRHTFTAVFIPADANAYRTSTSNQVSITIPAPHLHGR